MTTYLILTLSGFIALFIIKSKRAYFFSLAEQSVGLLNDLLSEEEDDVKLELLQTSTNKLVIILLKNVLLFVIALILAVIPIVIFNVVSTQEINFTSWQSILAVSIGASLPFFIPSKNKSTSNYSELSQLLHRLALDNYTIGYKLFKRESRAALKKNSELDENFLIVTGLARAGTTSLLLGLQKSNSFSSLNYANMPFLMSPNTWKRIYNPKQSEQKERSHGDGIKIGLDSTEALEEYFFKLKDNDGFIEKNNLNEYNLSDEDYKDYLSYQAIVKNGSDKIYLAKNNNFLLRYDSIRKRNKEFVTLILCRHPLYHAASLLEKHLFYSELQKEDPFVLEYMNWLGHHEFGNNQKVFEFENGVNFLNSDKSSLDYWLEVWMNFYKRVLQIEDENTLVVTYEKFCSNPNKVIASLLTKMNLQESSINLEAHNNTREVQLHCTNNLLKEAEAIYTQIENKA